MEMGVHSLSCRFKNCDDNFIWIFFGVCGSVGSADREELWVLLRDIKGLLGNPWCIGGVFNVVRFLGERRNCLRISPSMRRFSKIIEEFHLRDLPLVGGAILGVVTQIIDPCPG